MGLSDPAVRPHPTVFEIVLRSVNPSWYWEGRVEAGSKNGLDMETQCHIIEMINRFRTVTQPDGNRGYIATARQQGRLL